MALLHSDTLARKVLLAVELVDPVTGARVSDGVKVVATDAQGRPLPRPEPVASASRRFVWLQPNVVQPVTVWPARLRVEPRRELPYAARDFPAPQPAADPSIADDGTSITAPGDRLIRVVLWPTAAYPFEGVTAVRGVLRESGPGSAPVPGAIVQLATPAGGAWRPPVQGMEPPASALAAITDEKGQFGVVLPDRPPPNLGWPAPQPPPGAVRVRLQVTRRIGGAVESRRTSDAVGELPPAGIPGNRLFTPAGPIRWDQLTDQ